MKYLTYHAIGEKGCEVGAGLYCVSVDRFKEQMEYVAKYTQTVSFGDILCVSFDDGDITNYRYAYPILKEHGLKAYFFILVSRVGTKGYMNWEQIKELSDNGMIIGSHCMRHKILTELYDKELDFELKGSKRFMEDNLGHTIDYFSIPRGFYNQRIIEKAKEAGYKAVFTSSPNDRNGFRLGRIVVKRDWDLDYFIRVINNGLGAKDRAREIIKDCSKKILGHRRYDEMRSRVLMGRE